MFRKYILIAFSIVHMIGVTKLSNTQRMICDSIKVSVDLCIFAFCPESPVGVAIAAGSILVAAAIIESLEQWITGEEKGLIETIAKGIPKSIGAGIYIASLYSGMPSLFLGPICALSLLAKYKRH